MTIYATLCLGYCLAQNNTHQNLNISSYGHPYKPCTPAKIVKEESKP